MASYRVLIKPSAAREIEAVGQKKDRQRIVAKIRSLGDDPRPPGCEKLAGQEGRYRIRSGRYRVIYSIGDADLVELSSVSGTVEKFIGRRANSAALAAALSAVRRPSCIDRRTHKVAR